MVCQDTPRTGPGRGPFTRVQLDAKRVIKTMVPTRLHGASGTSWQLGTAWHSNVNTDRGTDVDTFVLTPACQ
eukprot:362480-Chlamydomonas_euryale.AAC.1